MSTITLFLHSSYSAFLHSECSAFLRAGSFLLILIYGTHLVRIIVFNRYEAATFECSTVTSLLSILLFLQYGQKWWVLAFFMLALFFANACIQRYFYKILQKRVKNVFSRKGKSVDIKKKANVEYELFNLVSAAIMPTFSSFIEESKLFNSPENIIGLFKSLMKRQRFQQKKYQMRECSADCINLIGPCIPNAKQMPDDSKLWEPVHACDLALERREEVKGLAWFDFLGFGALIITWCIFSVIPFSSIVEESTACQNTIFPVVLIVYSFFCYSLRKCAFSRHEFVGYEMSVAALISSSFRIYLKKLSADPDISKCVWIAFWIILFLYLIMSLVILYLGRTLKKQSIKTISVIRNRIPPDSETNCVKRRFLNNLIVMSEWVIVPYLNGKSSLRAKWMNNLIHSIAPELKLEDSSKDFTISYKKQIVLKAGISILYIWTLVLVTYVWIKI